MIASNLVHTDAAILAIETLASLEASSVLVDRGRQPDGSGWQGEPDASDFRPYVVIYPSPGTPDGPVAEPTEYLDYQVQATCVAATSAGAETVADLVRRAWADQPLPIVGRTSYRGQLYTDRPVTRDDSVSPSVHFSIIQATWRTQA